MAKEKYKKLTPAQRKREEEKVFAAFGVGKGEQSMRAFIRGQRKINGRLYAAIEAILDSLPQNAKQASMEATSADTFKNRAKAKRYNDSVPGPPPGCEPPGGG